MHLDETIEGCKMSKFSKIFKFISGCRNVFPLSSIVSYASFQSVLEEIILIKESRNRKSNLGFRSYLTFGQLYISLKIILFSRTVYSLMSSKRNNTDDVIDPSSQLLITLMPVKCE